MEWKNGVASLNFLTFEQNAADAVQLPVIRYLFSVSGDKLLSRNLPKLRQI